MTYRDVTVKSGDELDRDQVPHSDTEDLDASTAPQMEWDPQTDVASPMLPIQGEPSTNNLMITAQCQQLTVTDSRW